MRKKERGRSEGVRKERKRGTKREDGVRDEKGKKVGRKREGGVRR